MSKTENRTTILYVSYRYGMLAPYREDLKDMLEKVPDAIGSPDAPLIYQESQLVYKADGFWYMKCPLSNFAPDTWMWVDPSKSRDLDFGYLKATGIKLPDIE